MEFYQCFGTSFTSIPAMPLTTTQHTDVNKLSVSMPGNILFAEFLHAPDEC